MEQCSTCNATMWRAASHRCNPMWSVQSVGWGGADDGDDLDTTVRAVDAGDAAALAVERSWADDGMTEDPSEPVRVKVREHGSSQWTVFKVSGEQTIDWTAREVSDGQ